MGAERPAERQAPPRGAPTAARLACEGRQLAGFGIFDWARAKPAPGGRWRDPAAPPLRNERPQSEFLEKAGLSCAPSQCYRLAATNRVAAVPRLIARAGAGYIACSQTMRPVLCA